MFKHLRKLKGQSTLEYAVLVIIVIGALLSIQVYIKRGVQGRLRSSADDIGDQYSAGNMNIRRSTTTTSNTTETNEGGVVSTVVDNEFTYTTAWSNITNTEFEYWGKNP